MNTTFALVASYQYLENYAFDEDGNLDTENPYWKAKGTHEEVICENLDISEVMELAEDQEFIQFLIDSMGPKDNEACRFAGMDWEFDERSQGTLDSVLEYIKTLEGREVEVGYMMFAAPSDLGMSEKTVQWALTKLKERGSINYNENWLYGYSPIEVLK